MSYHRRVVLSVIGCTAWAIGAPSSFAQVLPWVVFTDAVSGSTCDLINAENAELVLLHDTGELVIVSETDVILGDAFVDEVNNVFFEGFPVGLIGFATDRDGFRTLWWTGLTGEVVAVDPFSGEPTATDSRPDDFRSAACDACLFWDDSSVCEEPEESPPPTTVRICGQDVSFPLGMLFFGLLGARFHRGRHRP